MGVECCTGMDGMVVVVDDEREVKAMKGVMRHANHGFMDSALAKMVGIHIPLVAMILLGTRQ